MRGITNWLEAHKPAASRRAHLLCASIMWTLVGAALMIFGIRWILQSGAALSVVILAAALVVGVLKSRFVLKRAAERIGSRIIRRGQSWLCLVFAPYWSEGRRNPKYSRNCAKIS